MIKKFFSKKLSTAVLALTLAVSIPQPAQAGLWEWMTSFFNSKQEQISTPHAANTIEQQSTSGIQNQKPQNNAHWFSWFNSWNPFNWFFRAKKQDIDQEKKIEKEDFFDDGLGLHPHAHKLDKTEEDKTEVQISSNQPLDSQPNPQEQILNEAIDLDDLDTENSKDSTEESTSDSSSPKIQSPLGINTKTVENSSLPNKQQEQIQPVPEQKDDIIISSSTVSNVVVSNTQESQDNLTQSEKINTNENSTFDSDDYSFIEVPDNEHAEPTPKNHEPYVFNAHRLTEYCYSFAEKKGLDTKKYSTHAKQQVNLGGRYAFYILSGQPEHVPQSSKEEINSTIEALMWYFYHEHLCKTFAGNGFEEGSFLIPKEFASFFKNKNAGYNRISSHVKKLKPGTNTGIDIHKPVFQNKEHILAIPIDHENFKEYYFIKPENHGTSGITNTFFHLWEFAVAQARKIQSIQEFMGMKSDDDTSYKKERIPSLVKKAYKQIINQCNLPQQSEKEYLDAAEVGIFKMYTNAQYLLSTIDNEDAAEGLKKFVSELHKNYDNLHVRIGDEVILPKETLLISSNCYYLSEQNKNDDPFHAYALTLSQVIQLIEAYKKNPNNTNLSEIQKNLTFLQRYENSTQITKNFDSNLNFLKEYIQNNTQIFKHALQSEQKVKDLIMHTPFLEYNAQIQLVKQINLEEKENETRPKLLNFMQEKINHICSTGEKALLDIQYTGNKNDYEQLNTKFNMINDESTGLRKITEWRRITSDNVSDLEKPIISLLSNIEKTIRQVQQENKSTEELETLCDKIYDLWQQSFEDIVKKAHELGFYTHRHQDIKDIVAKKASILKTLAKHRMKDYEKAIQLFDDDKEKLDYNSLVQQIKPEITRRPSSFEHQIGFSYGDKTPLLETLNKSFKAISKELEQKFPPLSTPSKHPHPFVAKLQKLNEKKNGYLMIDLTQNENPINRN